MTVLLCPLCSQPRFSNLESLRLSLINAATQNISCPICDDTLMGLDKLTIHLFGHTLNHDQKTSLELKAGKIAGEHCPMPEDQVLFQHPTAAGQKAEIIKSDISFDETRKNEKSESDKIFGYMDSSYDSDEASKILQSSDVGSDNLCTVNMEDLSFLMGLESNAKPRQDQKDSDRRHADENEENKDSDLSEYMSDLLNKKLPVSNFSFGPESDEKGKSLEKLSGCDGKKLKCGFCGFVFQNAIVLSMHQKLVHSKMKIEDKINSISSDFCRDKMKSSNFGKSSPQEKYFHGTFADSHWTEDASEVSPSHISQVQLSVVSGNDAQPDDSLYRYDCHLCTKSFKMKGSLLVHFRMAHLGLNCNSLQNLSDPSPLEKRNHACPTCSKSFKKEQHLSQHIKTHEGKQWQCETCNKHFTTKYFLKKHQRLHTGEMPYSCLACNKTFTFQQSYHKHLLYHSDEKPHRCAQCGRSFKELSTLHNHQRIHSGEKPFACETCGKCFRQRVSYIVHQRIHTGVLPYQCTACKKKFRYKVSQRSHKCTSQPPGIVIRQPDLVQKILENKSILQHNAISDTPFVQYALQNC